MPETAFDDVYKNGVRVSRTERIISDAQIERRDASALLRSRLPNLRAWSNDAQDAAAITAMTAAQRITRQAVIETRVAALSRLMMILIWQSGEDDGI